MKIKGICLASLATILLLGFGSVSKAFAQSASQRIDVSVEVVSSSNSENGGDDSKPITEKIIEAISHPDAAPDAVRTILSYIGIDKKKAASTSLVVTAAAVFAVLPAASLINTASLFSLSEYLKMIWLQFLSLFGVKKRKGKSWGKITESNSDMSIPQAKVDLFALTPEGGKKLYASTYTDKSGSYGFVATPGKYVIEVSKGDYNLLTPESTRTIEIKNEKESFIGPQIIMTMGEDKLRKKLKIITTINYLEKVLRTLSILFIIIGTIVALDDLFKQKDLKEFIVAGTYVVMWLLVWSISNKKSPWGSVTEQVSTKPVSLALVRIMDKSQDKKLVQTSISNQSGKFSAVVKRGDYRVLVVKPEYELIRPHFFSTKKDIGAINLDIVLRHHG